MGPLMARSKKRAMGQEVLIVDAVALSRFECLHLPSDVESNLAEHELDVALGPQQPGTKTGQHYAGVLCRCMRTVEGGEGQAIFTAMYGVLFSGQFLDDTGSLSEASKLLIASSAYSHFRNLFAVVNMQMVTRMPDLPFYPHGVTEMSAEEMAAGFDYY